MRPYPKITFRKIKRPFSRRGGKNLTVSAAPIHVLLSALADTEHKILGGIPEATVSAVSNPGVSPFSACDLVVKASRRLVLHSERVRV